MPCQFMKWRSAQYANASTTTAANAACLRRPASRVASHSSSSATYMRTSIGSVHSETLTVSRCGLWANTPGSTLGAWSNASTRPRST